MKTACNTGRLAFQPLGGREVVGAFDGGTITSDAGGLLLREVEQRTGIIRQFAACFVDHRDPELIEHTVEELVAQRVYGLALGYEDLNDHDRLRLDPLLATLVGKEDPTGQSRLRERDRGKPLAGKSTLNRLELTAVRADAASRYKKIPADTKRLEGLFVEWFVQAHAQPPERIVLDLDATDDPVHGNQLGRFFHGYYQEYCYLPLYVFCGDELLGAWLRPADIDGASGALKRVAAAGVAGDAAGPGPVRHDSREVIEDRGANPGDGSEDLGGAGRGVPLRGRVSTGVSELAGHAADVGCLPLLNGDRSGRRGSSPGSAEKPRAKR